MSFWYKVLAFTLFVTVVFSSGVLVEYKFNLASQVPGLKKTIVRVGEGQNDIIKFNQDLRKSNADKEPCFNTDMPESLRGLLH